MRRRKVFRKKTLHRILRIMIAWVLCFNFSLLDPAGWVQNTRLLAAGEDGFASYIEDIKVFYGVNESNAVSQCEAEGYTAVKSNLNEGTRKGQYVCIGYKTTDNKAKAVRKLGLLAMDKGYEIRDYKKLEEKYKQSNYAAADALCSAAVEFTNYFHEGSPKAIEAYEGLNMAYVPEAGEKGLGDYIIGMGDDQDRDFYAKLLTTASSGIVNSIISFLYAGMAPYNNEEDEDGNAITVNWAQKVIENPLWEQVEEDNLTEEELDSMDQNYMDSAKTLFKKLQDFTALYENAECNFDEDRIDELQEEGSDIEEAMDDTEKLDKKDTSLLYMGCYEQLNNYKINDDMPLGEWFVNIGKLTSEEVDYRQLYPVVDSFTDAERQMIGVGGLMSVIGSLEENEKTDLYDETLEEARRKVYKLLGEDDFSIWSGSNEELFTKTFAYTSDAIRQNSAGKLLEDAETPTDLDKANDIVEEVNKWWGIVSGTVFVVSFILGSYGLPLVLSGVGFVLTKLGLTTVVTGITSVCSSLVAIGTTVSTIMSYVLVVDLIVLIGYGLYKLITYFVKLAKEAADSEYSTIPDYLIDVMDTMDKTVQVKYKVTLNNIGSKGDLDGYRAHRGWVSLYQTTDTRIGSPLVVPKTGDPFKVVYGDSADRNGMESLTFFGEISPGNCNSGMEYDDVNGIYIFYTTEDSLKSKSAASAVNTSESGTSAVTKYYADMIVRSARTESQAKAKIIQKGFQVWDQNLTPDARNRKEGYQSITNGDKDTQYTYIGYKITTDPSNAIRDIRVASFEHGSSLTFGCVNYACAGTLGYPADSDKEDEKFPSNLDGLYYSKNEKSGTPIPAGKIHMLSSHDQAEAGWVPVTTFGGLPYNFNTTRLSSDDKLNNWGDGRYLAPYQYTLYASQDEYSWNETDGYMYYEPTEKYTEGTKYLSGIYFTFGTDSEHATWSKVAAVKSSFTELVDKMKSVPNSNLLGDINLAQSYYYKGYLNESNQKYLHIGYLWSYNPYRAIYDVQAYQGTLYKSELPYTVNKTTKYSKKNLGEAAEQQSYAAVSIVFQRPLQSYTNFLDKDISFNGRGLLPENAYISTNGLSGRHEELRTKTYTTTLMGDYDYGYDKMPFLPTGIFMSGYISDKEPLTLDDIVISSKRHDGELINGKVVADMSGEKTLGGNAATGEFSSIQELKRPYNTKAFNISYPEWTNDSNDHYDAGKELYIYKKRPAVKKKYISRVFVGAYTREESGYDNEDMLYEVDKMVDYQALLIATSQASDEVIPVNASVPKEDAWYRNQTKKEIAATEPEKGKKSPAAYISVSRTDKEDEAITGMVLYKTDKKAVPEEMKVDSMTYYCASNTTPITLAGGSKYYLYYTYNTGATPGKPITDITVTEDLFISGQSTTLVVDRPDGKGGDDASKPYGDTSLYNYIHAEYEHDQKTYFNKLFIGSDIMKKKALTKLLEQDCTEFIDMNLNENAGGNYIYMGYKGYSLDEDKIRMKATKEAKETEKENQLQEAIYDIICTVDKPYNPDGFVTELNQIYYKPVSDTDLNAGTSGPKIYMYYTTIYNAKKYNKNQGTDTRKMMSSMPNDYFKTPLTRIAFALGDRVPYQDGVSSSGLSNNLPWERVLCDDNRTAAELNDGAVWFDDDYNSMENRIYMFAQREDGSVKGAGEITGGNTSDETIYGEMWLNR